MVLSSIDTTPKNTFRYPFSTIKLAWDEAIIKESNPLKNNTPVIDLIESLRNHLDYLIKQGKTFTDPEILIASRALDEAINNFYKNSSYD
ncbi:MAG: aspartyl-phosphate phosphatase Spo0E family protein [Syntrophomonadaceae bacterium]|jgi:hypothetical protein